MRTGIVIFLLVLCSTAYAQETHLLAASDTLPHAFMAPAPPHSLVAQDDLATPINLLPPPGQIDWGRFGISSGVLAASIVGLHILQNNSWWANQRQSFHIYDDPIYQANFDKFGHMFGAYYTSHFFNEAFTWSNLDSAQADLLGALCGAMYEFYVEIEDGYAHDWGFSPGDATGDLVGATFFLLRNRIDFLRNFQYKWFYYPSPQYLTGHDNIPGQTFNPIDDYEGQSYWIAMDVHRMLPESLKGYWPAWLNLAVGFGAYKTSNLVTSADYSSSNVLPQMELLVGLDYDLAKIIPESDIGILNFIRRGLSYWHFPAPAYRIRPDPRFFILFPLQMTIK